MSDLADRAAHMAEIARQRERDAKSENRRAMPLATAEIDKIRKWFGTPRSGNLTENGRTAKWGTPPEQRPFVPRPWGPGSTRYILGVKDE